MGGCASNAGDDSAGYVPGTRTTLSPGAQVTLPDQSRLRYVEVVADSRCRPGQQCIRAGDADVRFELATAPGGTRVLTLNMPGRATAVAAGWRVELLELTFDRPPAATIRIVTAPP